ncbi:PAP2-domain-containing protein [Artomyces pyxidatus]|uniref:PAP2-domain-containing protein n=1 Tax=Artomyces pyxidatus TaxID=48021 RepID=A0ACB8TIU7_9AGAM|nr:PAP2-domain-containing protein [Artomyces pyxidatus]
MPSGVTPPPSYPSYGLRILDRTNIIVTGITACFILYTRSAGAAYFSLGAVACSVTVKILKRLLRQARPPQVTQRKQKKTYGMPSTHSATITYYGTYIPLACTYLPLHDTLPPSIPVRLLAPALTIPFALLILTSRVWLGHHTWPQVFVGCLYGLAFGCLWFTIWMRGANQYGAVVERLVITYIGRS